MIGMLSLLAVAIGGGAGSALRWGVAHLWATRGPHREGRGIPWPTFAVNALACFILGLVVTWFGTPGQTDAHVLYLLLATGFCGGLSTLSTFALEVVDLLRGGAPVLSLAYLMLSAGTGMIALWLGLVLAA